MLAKELLNASLQVSHAWGGGGVKIIIEWVETSCGYGDELTSDNNQQTHNKNQCFTITDKCFQC